MPQPPKQQVIIVKSDPPLSRSRKIKNALWVTAGTIFLGLGLVGIALPLLPTTPFLLLTAWCYYHGSERMHNWLLNHRWFGKYIRAFMEKKGIPLKAKIIAITMIWTSMGFSMYFFIDNLWIHIIMASVGLGVTIYILSYKTV